MDFTEINFPADYEYSSDEDRIPLEFYLDVLPRSKVVYLKLGYFSSKAIQVLALGFAQFIYNGGTIKIVSNHFLYDNDKELLEGGNASDVLTECLIQDLEWIFHNLNSSAQHFFDCLKLLVKENRLEIIPVMLKPGRMAHFKEGIFIDEFENVIFMNGSCNFTANGLIQNGEALSVLRSWGSNFEKNKISSKYKDIKSLIDKENLQYEYLSKEKVLDAISEIGRDKDVEELLSEELSLIKDVVRNGNVRDLLDKYREDLEKKIDSYKSDPRFPYREGPREYQKDAYIEWLKNNKRGIFSMATGTGKTITSLNCLLNEYHERSVYQAVILVPGRVLVTQWKEEAEKFNLKNIFLAYSDNNWIPELERLNTSFIFDKLQSFVIIATYKTFVSEKFQSRINKLPKETLLIADEVHNMGGPMMQAILPDVSFENRIGLSATPKRKWDPEGLVNSLIEDFFDSREPYTYSFSMERAIRENVLCQYDYYPHIVYLSEEEMVDYIDKSKQLSRLFDANAKTFRNPDFAKILVLERKRIIHKASNKKECFKNIIVNHMKEHKSLAYTFVYAPEGEDENRENILNSYIRVLGDCFPGVRAYPYTHKSDNRQQVMENFESGYVDVLFSMQCLDEGVDVPRAELAIFCSSTGNPRQFIQRRGRVLRQHKDKDHAVIHDIVVIPQNSGDEDTFSLEQKLIKDELTRVIYFASLARNHYEAMGKCESVAEYYDLDMFAMEKELKE